MTLRAVNCQTVTSEGIRGFAAISLPARAAASKAPMRVRSQVEGEMPTCRAGQARFPKSSPGGKKHQIRIPPHARRFKAGHIPFEKTGKCLYLLSHSLHRKLPAADTSSSIFYFLVCVFPFFFNSEIENALFQDASIPSSTPLGY